MNESTTQAEQSPGGFDRQLDSSSNVYLDHSSERLLHALYKLNKVLADLTETVLGL